MACPAAQWRHEKWTFLARRISAQLVLHNDHSGVDRYSHLQGRPVSGGSRRVLLNQREFRTSPSLRTAGAMASVATLPNPNTKPWCTAFPKYEDDKGTNHRFRLAARSTSFASSIPFKIR